MATSISTTLAAGSTASPYYLDCIITKQLCQKTCASKPPLFAPTFTLVSSNLVGTGVYELIINVSGTVTYTPCGKCDCNARTQVVDEDFVVPLYSTAEPSAITVSGSVIKTSVKTSGCSNCGNVMKSDCLLGITVTTA